MNVRFSTQFESYIQAQLDLGIYNNASEVIRDALRLKMQQDELYRTKLEALKQAIALGEASGEAVPFDLTELLEEVHTEVGLDD